MKNVFRNIRPFKQQISGYIGLLLTHIKHHFIHQRCALLRHVTVCSFNTCVEPFVRQFMHCRHILEYQNIFCQLVHIVKLQRKWSRCAEKK